MDSALSRPARIGLDIFLVYVGLFTLINGLIATQALRGWILGDWLINYEGGFVRRGLMGEAALLLARLFHTSPVFFVVLCYLSFYAVFFVAFRSLATTTSGNFLVFALILSPATLSFQILHRGSGFRKEVIYLAAFTLFVGLLRKTRVSSLFVAAYLSGVLIVGTLSHEGLIFYSPYFVAALLISGRSIQQTARVCVVPLLFGSVAFAACISHLGSVATASQICSSIGYKLESLPGSTEICSSGAIPYLAKTRALAGEEALEKIRDYQYLWVFPCYLLLALLPAIGESIVLVRARMNRDVKILWVTAAISFIGTLILFRYAVDWGRWIYIHTVSIAVLLLFIDSKRVQTKPRTTSNAPEPIAWKKVLQWAFVVVYATFWILPSDTESLRMGYAGRLLETLHVTSKSQDAERIPSHVSAAVP